MVKNQTIVPNFRRPLDPRPTLETGATADRLCPLRDLAGGMGHWLRRVVRRHSLRHPKSTGDAGSGRYTPVNVRVP